MTKKELLQALAGCPADAQIRVETASGEHFPIIGMQAYTQGKSGFLVLSYGQHSKRHI